MNAPSLEELQFRIDHLDLARRRWMILFFLCLMALVLAVIVATVAFIGSILAITTAGPRQWSVNEARIEREMADEARMQAERARDMAEREQELAAAEADLRQQLKITRMELQITQLELAKAKAEIDALKKK